MEEVKLMQRVAPGYRIPMYAAAFVAAIATVLVVPSAQATAQSASSVASHVCPPLC